MAELIDIHFHLPDPVTFPDFVARGRKRLLMHFLLRRMRLSGNSATSESIAAYNQGILKSIAESRLDRVVLLALDAPHHEDGSRDTGPDSLVCRNVYLAALAQTSSKTLFGASIHPWRKDALQELERCIANGACLVKWLPSAQNIDPGHERCIPFYEMLAACRVPLLSHTGCEHTLAGHRNELNDPARLLPAVKRGVTVIAAHCGTRLLLHERSYFRTWCRLAREHGNFFGDISAFATLTRMHLLSAIIKDDHLSAKVLYGSDFPGFPDPAGCLFTIGLRRTMALQRERNPVNRSLRVMQELGVPESVFSRAGSLLRQHPSRRPVV